MQLNRSALGLGPTSLEKNRLANPADTTTAVQRTAQIQGKEKSAGTLPTKVERIYLLQEAPKRTIRSMREARATGTYPMEMDQNRSKDAANQKYLLRLEQMLSDMGQSAGPGEASFINKHLSMLIQQREAYLNSENYSKLDWLSAPSEAARQESRSQETDSLNDTQSSRETQDFKEEQAYEPSPSSRDSKSGQADPARPAFPGESEAPTVKANTSGPSAQLPLSAADQAASGTK